MGCFVKTFALSYLRPTRQLLGLSRSVFSVKDIIYDNFNSGAGTLNTKFIKHIALEKCKHDELIPQEIRYSDYYPLTDVRSFNNLIHKTKNAQLPRLITFTHVFKANGNPALVVQIINKIDEHCLHNLEDFSENEIVNIFYGFMYLIPNRITQLEFFLPALRRIVQRFKETSTKEQFVEVTFYLGLLKRNRENSAMLQKFMSAHLKRFIDELTSVDLAIVSNALFKTSTTHQFEYLNQRLEKEIIEGNPQDDALMVTFVKSLRMNRWKSESLLRHLKALVTNDKLNHLQFKGLVHIFAYFSECMWNDEELCHKMTEICMQRIEGYDGVDENLNDVRAKDFSTFLWCCANLQTNELTNEDLQLIEDIVKAKIQRREYHYANDELIDTVLSLWILNYKSKDLLDAVIENTAMVKEKYKNRVKLDSRLKLLYNCANIETPDWVTDEIKNLNVFDEARQAPAYIIEKYPKLTMIHRTIVENLEELELKKAILVNPINEINIPGILSESIDGKSKFYLEIDDENRQLEFGSKPNMLLSLKIRLLELFGYQILRVQMNQKSHEEILNEVAISIKSKNQNLVEKCIV